MKATYIDYSETHSFSSTVLRYLSRDPELCPFISHSPTIEGFGKLLEKKAVAADREVLVEVLRKQYKRILKEEAKGEREKVYEGSLYGGRQADEVSVLAKEHGSAVEANIELLRLPDTYTITTGHQLNIFTGPLYFIYKIVTAINLAADLKKAFPGKNFVPVYWMATEDHDFAEINHTSLHGKPVAWKHDARGATGRLPTDSIAAAVKEYCSFLGMSENSERLTAIVEEAYLEHDTLADATRSLVNALFAAYGLVIIDADDPALKKQFAAIIKEDIITQKSFQLISQASTVLEEKGFGTQVNAREINFFYMKDGLRERLVKDGDAWYVLNTNLKFTEDELTEEISRYPERFSPNVIMRPLYQEVILPNLAYIGGGAEIVYWLQLKANFDHYGIDFPILVLRNSAMITDEAFHAKLCRLHIRLKDIFKDTETLQKEWILAHTHNVLSLADEKKEFQAVFEKIKLRAYKIDPTLAPSTDAVKARLQKALNNLERKLVKAEKRNYEGAITQIENLRSKYFPGGGLQERSENFGLLYVKYGDQFIRELVRHFRPLDFKFTILEPSA